MQERARELLPQVLLTLLSLIQAIALEGLWSRIRDVEANPYLFQGGFVAVAGFLQVSAIVLGILLVWLLYTSMVIRFRWVPTTRDSLFPFAIGLLEFAAIEMLGPGRAVAWVGLMAIIYVLGTWASNDIFVRAARERGEHVPWMEARGLRHAVVAVGAHLVLAVGLAVLGGDGGFAVLAYATINALLLAQIAVVHRITSRAMAGETRETSPQDGEADGGSA